MTDWIDWPGGECPVDDKTIVEVRMVGDELAAGRADDFCWDTSRRDLARIVAYRVLPTFADLAAKDAEIERLKANYADLANLNLAHQLDNDRLSAELAVARSDRMRFARALVDVMDGMQDHDIQSHTGAPQTDCDAIAEARESARAAIKGEA